MKLFLTFLKPEKIIYQDTIIDRNVEHFVHDYLYVAVYTETTCRVALHAQFKSGKLTTIMLTLKRHTIHSKQGPRAHEAVDCRR